MEVVAWAGILVLIGLILIYLSKDQPFPEISRFHGIILLCLAGFVFISTSSPRAFDEQRITATIITIISGIQLIIGTWHMVSTQRDVIVGPLTGILLCMGAVFLFADDWALASKNEQNLAFITISFLLLLESYLFFKGMIIGIPAKMWSLAGLRNIERGLLKGERGAIGCFEKAWDMEEEYINAMSYSALEKIYSHLKNKELQSEYHEKLLRLGGINSVDPAWIDAIESALNELESHLSEE